MDLQTSMVFQPVLSHWLSLLKIEVIPKKTTKTLSYLERVTSNQTKLEF